MKEKVTIVTPRDPKQRGCQLSLRVEGVESKHLEEDLRNEGVVVDVRGPIIRAAPTPLYNRFEGKDAFYNISPATATNRTFIQTYIVSCKSCASLPVNKS